VLTLRLSEKTWLKRSMKRTQKINRKKLKSMIVSKAVVEVTNKEE
jgi:hypothetical protein